MAGIAEQFRGLEWDDVVEAVGALGARDWDGPNGDDEDGPDGDDEENAAAVSKRAIATIQIGGLRHSDRGGMVRRQSKL